MPARKLTGLAAASAATSHLATAPADLPATPQAKSAAPGPKTSYGDNNNAWRTSPATLAFPHGWTTLAQATPQPHPTVTPPHRHFGKPISWLSNGAGIAGRNSRAAHHPPPPLPQHRDTDPDPGGGWKPDKMAYKVATLRLHAELPTPHSSLLTQIRTGKIGLAAFLYQRRVPNVESPACPCGWQWETAKHVVLNCPRFTRQR